MALKRKKKSILESKGVDIIKRKSPDGGIREYYRYRKMRKGINHEVISETSLGEDVFKEKIEKLTEQLESHVVDIKITFEDIFLDWLYNIKSYSNAKKSSEEIKSRTLAGYLSLYNAHLKNSSISKKKLVDITADNIEDLYRQMFRTKKKYKNHSEARSATYSTIKNVDKLLKQFFKYADDRELVIKNIMTKVKILVPKNSEKVDDDPFVLPTRTQVTTFLKDLRNHPQYDLLFNLLIATGARKGEMLGLRFCDVDDEKIKIFKTAHYGREKAEDGTLSKKYKWFDTTTKTGNSTRTIPFPPHLLNLFKKHTVAQQEKHLALGKKFSDKTYIFTNSNCNILCLSTLHTKYKRILDNCNIDSRTKIHDLRKIFITFTIEDTLDVASVQAIVGHKSSSMTLDVYTQISSDKKKEVMSVTSENLKGMLE